MYSREDVVKLLLNKRGVDPFSTGGVSTTNGNENINVFFYFNPWTFEGLISIIMIWLLNILRRSINNKSFFNRITYNLVFNLVGARNIFLGI